MTAKLTEKPRKSPLPRPARRHLVVARGDTRFAAPHVARFVPAKAVGSYVPTLTRKAFQKFGFSTAALITDWPQIAGAELASYTIPDRLKWPRAAEVTDPSDDDTGQRPGAVLVLRVDPARALDVEYRTRQILDRINAYFGYRAVAALRLIQTPLEAKPGRAIPRPKEEAPRLAAPGATEDPLQAALARLEQGVRGRP